ncbi:DUF948 domain-containing protein [Paenibacillus sp. IHBB 10380]|uniref:DUF948 domain-containing protein n=1 Tax=Paenibacillus sp. IHBB 10380 TaxID=1566358 RepID=UPI0005CFBB0C|nr:DUF948 domain-containing protein [Paenibacillus sp. IHBB 10380]AJS60146.1 hypothetical protein UB51_18645 [Paenibacillus sp. IHBB 10380]
MIEISVALIAVAFAVLVIFLIKTLRAATQSLDKTTQTLQEVQKTIDELSYEVKQTIRHANDITVDVQAKMKQIDPVMDSVQNIGEVLSEVTLAAKQVSTTLIDKMKSNKRHVSAPQPSHESAASSAEQRTVQSYATVNNSTGATKPAPSWVKYVDVAAEVWKKFRH